MIFQFNLVFCFLYLNCNCLMRCLVNIATTNNEPFFYRNVNSWNNQFQRHNQQIWLDTTLRKSSVAHQSRRINHILHRIAVLRQLLFDVPWKSYARAMNSNNLSKWLQHSVATRVNDMRTENNPEMLKQTKETIVKARRSKTTNKQTNWNI